MKKIIYLFMLIAFSQACNIDTNGGKKVTLEFKEITIQSSNGGEPNLFVSENEKLYLSWLEYDNDSTFSLRYSTLNDTSWTKANVINSGADWFVNWADFPSIAAYDGSNPSLAAHWLQMSADGTYDYDIKISQSHDMGENWSGIFTPHTDGIAAEHGFVSMIPLSEERMFVTWLDGRNTKTGEDTGNHHGHGAGAMTLRAATFDKDGNLYDQVELDDRVCDCCQTSAAVVEDGIVVAYRNRTKEEIRDIAVIRKKGDHWLPPKIVYADNWKFPGCPVNGPVIRASGTQVAVSWFAMNDTIPEVKVAFSSDSGENFGSPIRIDQGNPLGRVDLVFLSPESILASWLEQKDDGASIMAVKVNTDGNPGEPLEIMKTKSSRSSGFPRMARIEDKVIFAWTHIDSTSRIRTLQMHI